MTLKLKLIGGLFLCFFVALVTIFYGGLSGQSISDSSESLREKTFPALEEARALQNIVYDTKLIFQDAIETTDELLLDSAKAKDDDFKKITQQIFAKTGERDIIELAGLFTNYVGKASKQVGRIVRGEPILELFDLGTSELDSKIKLYRENKRKAFSKSLRIMQDQATNFKQTFVVLGSFAIVVIGMILIVVMNIQKRIGSVVGHAARLASGDFESQIRTKDKDELGTLEDTFESMRVALRTHIIALDKLVADRTKELEMSKNQIQEILDNINQGILILDFDGKLVDQHSKKAEEIFETSKLEGELLADVLKANQEDRKVFNMWLSTILKPQFQENWKDRGLDRLNPFNLIKMDGQDGFKYVQFDFELVFNPEGELGFIMVLATDVTKIKQIEEAHREQEEQVSRLLAFIDNDIEAISFFLTNSIQSVMMVRHLPYTEIVKNHESWMREFHTLRGNAGTFGFSALSNCASEVEDLLLDFDEENSISIKQSLKSFSEELEKISVIRDKILHRDESRIEVDSVLFNQLLKNSISDNVNIDFIKSTLIKLPNRRWASFGSKYTKILEEAANKTSKGEILLELTPQNFLVPDSLFEVIDGPLVHMIRNSVDHGIELPSIRGDLGKGTAKISLHLEENDEHYILTVSDNGSGLDPNHITGLSLQKGLLKEDELKELSEDEKLQLVFRHGFSSKSSVGYFSGRGVGMDVVKTEIENIGGAIQIENTLGEGVSFRLAIPKKAISV